MSGERAFAEQAQEARAILGAAASLADGTGTELVDALVASTRLSREGVVLALRVALEREATDDELRLLVSRVRPASEVTVVLASNVFVGALRAIVLGVVAAPRVFVRPSRRDPTFAQRLVGAVADPRISLVDDLVEARGVVHAYGSDATMAAIAAETGLPVWAHGAGLGVAIVSSRDEPVAAAGAIADDTVLFDQRGCLSPRIVYFSGPRSGAEAFAETLFAALAGRERVVPPGALDATEAREIATARDVAFVCGDVRGEAGAMVAVVDVEPGASCMLFPTGRHLVVVPVASEEALGAHLRRFGRALVTVGATDEALLARLAPPWARRASLGFLQRPRLDGPVDLRDVWLA